MGMIAQDPYQPETTWELRDNVAALCCDAVVQQGERVEVIRVTGKRVRFRQATSGHIHTANLGTFSAAARRASG